MLFNTCLTAVLVLACVAVHAQVLIWLRTHTPAWHTRPIFKLAGVVLLLLVTHVVEVFLFAVPMHLLTAYPGYGSLEGSSGRFSDTVYFSFVTYTTVGYGDITPRGGMQILAQVEALTGLLLVSCSGALVFTMLQDFVEFVHGKPGRDKG